MRRKRERVTERYFRPIVEEEPGEKEEHNGGGTDEVRGAEHVLRIQTRNVGGIREEAVYSQAIVARE